LIMSLWLADAYRLPRSVCQMSPLGGLRFQMAIRRASLTKCDCMRLLIDHPTTCLEYRSITTARYSQPSYVGI
jgi:hypothetical protein